MAVIALTRITGSPAPDVRRYPSIRLDTQITQCTSLEDISDHHLIPGQNGVGNLLNRRYNRVETDDSTFVTNNHIVPLRWFSAAVIRALATRGRIVWLKHDYNHRAWLRRILWLPDST